MHSISLLKYNFLVQWSSYKAWKTLSLFKYNYAQCFIFTFPHSFLVKNVCEEFYQLFFLNLFISHVKSTDRVLYSIANLMSPPPPAQKTPNFFSIMFL